MQMRVWEAQQQHEKEEKSRTQAKVWTAALTRLVCGTCCSGMLRPAVHALKHPARAWPGAHGRATASNRTRPALCVQAEFDAEQEYIKTLSYLSAEEQQRQRERAGVSFMYQKPPGYDAAMAKTAEVGRGPPSRRLHQCFPLGCMLLIHLSAVRPTFTQH